MIISQNIDIFDPSGPFFTDICYSYESPVKKDIPLKERILNYYPNIKLCDDNCIYKGIDYEKYEVSCECTISNIINNNIINNYFTSEAVSIISETNLDVLKCYKDVFSSKGFKQNYGGIIIICLSAIQLILCIFYIKNGFNKERQFAYGLIYSFINLLNKNKQSNGIKDIASNDISNIIENIKKDTENNKNNNKMNVNNNNENIYGNNINDNINNNNIKNNYANNNVDNKIISVPPKKRKKKKKNTHPPTNIININNISNRNEQMNNSNSINKNLLGRNKHKYLSHVVSNDLLRNSNEERILNENINNNIKGIKIKNNINIKK